ncbi:MAG: hypothetical protein QME61_00410 [Patescibacteria group bacterium]|nr:hypothetical protein [Patescibacteria group bacterium]
MGYTSELNEKDEKLLQAAAKGEFSRPSPELLNSEEWEQVEIECEKMHREFEERLRKDEDFREAFERRVKTLCEEMHTGKDKKERITEIAKLEILLNWENIRDKKVV